MAPPAMTDVVRGAGAGAVATVAMSAVMLAAGRLGMVGRQPPEAIVRRAGQLGGAEPRGRAAGVLASLAHLGFGAGTGAAYALLPPTARPVLRAVGVSLGVYAASYAGWVPGGGGGGGPPPAAPPPPPRGGGRRPGGGGPAVAPPPPRAAAAPPAAPPPPPPPRDRTDRQAVMAAAHVVYGAVLGALDARGRGRGLHRG